MRPGDSRGGGLPRDRDPRRRAHWRVRSGRRRRSGDGCAHRRTGGRLGALRGGLRVRHGQGSRRRLRHRVLGARNARAERRPGRVADLSSRGRRNDSQQLAFRSEQRPWLGVGVDGSRSSHWLQEAGHGAVARNDSGVRLGPETPRGTTLVPTATSNVSRTSTTVDGLDDLDAHGCIYMRFSSAGGRKVASSNLAAPTSRCRRRVPAVPRVPWGVTLAIRCRD